MIGRWLRRVGLVRSVPKMAPLPPLATTARELMATAPQHRKTIREADRTLRDWVAFDGAFRIVKGTR